jgi:hypothetical protein
MHAEEITYQRERERVLISVRGEGTKFSGEKSITSLLALVVAGKVR